MIERLAGTDVAASAAGTVGWRYYSPGTAATLPQERLTPANAVTHLLNLGFRANATTVDVAVTDGVGEIELASAFDPYAEIKAARTVAVAAGSSIRSRHGLTFIPRAGLDAVGRADRLLVPGAAAHPVSAVRRAGIPVVYLHRQPGFAFDPALRDLARTLDVPTARWAGKILEYPTAELALSGRRWPWMATVRPPTWKYGWHRWRLTRSWACPWTSSAATSSTWLTYSARRADGGRNSSARPAPGGSGSRCSTSSCRGGWLADRSPRPRSAGRVVGDAGWF